MLCLPPSDRRFSSPVAQKDDDVPSAERKGEGGRGGEDEGKAEREVQEKQKGLLSLSLPFLARIHRSTLS